jgi:hypothetical protein
VDSSTETKSQIPSEWSQPTLLSAHSRSFTTSFFQRVDTWSFGLPRQNAGMAIKQLLAESYQLS